MGYTIIDPKLHAQNNFLMIRSHGAVQSRSFKPVFAMGVSAHDACSIAWTVWVLQWNAAKRYSSSHSEEKGVVSH